MDFFLCLLIAWYALKNGSEDLVHAARGTESPRSRRRTHRLKTGQPSPAGRLGEAISTYLADWITDASTDAKAKRQDVRERRAAKKAEKAAAKAPGGGESTSDTAARDRVDIPPPVGGAENQPYGLQCQWAALGSERRCGALTEPDSPYCPTHTDPFRAPDGNYTADRDRSRPGEPAEPPDPTGVSAGSVPPPDDPLRFDKDQFTVPDPVGGGQNDQPNPAAGGSTSGPTATGTGSSGGAGNGFNGFGLGYVAGLAEERERQRWHEDADQPLPRRPEPVQAQAQRLDVADHESAEPPPRAPASPEDVMDVELVDQPTTTATGLDQKTDKELIALMDAASAQGDYRLSHACYEILDRRDRTGTSQQDVAAGELLTFQEGDLIALEPPRGAGQPRLRGCVGRVIKPGEEGNEDGMLPRLFVRYDDHFAEYEVEPHQIVRDNLDPRIPAEAHEPCRRCDAGMLRPIPDRGIHCDEGDGSAMVDTRCDNSKCRVESSHSWALSDEDYRDEFGHDFGEFIDDEDDDDLDPQGPSEPRDQQPLATVTPINTIPGGSSLSTPTPSTIPSNGGETVDPHSAMAFADSVGSVGSGLVGTIETSIANLVARGVSGEPIAHLQHMLEAAQQLEGNSTAARRYFEHHAQIQEVAQSDATVGGGTYLGIGQ